MFLSVSAIAVIAAVLVPFAALCLGEDGYNDAPPRSPRQAIDSNTQSNEMEDGYCAIPPPLDHGRFSPSRNRCPGTSSSLACQMIPGTPVPPNWVIFHSCIPGYKLQNGKTLSVCAKGKWVPPLPECVVDGCYLPDQPTQGSYEVANPSPCRPEEVGLVACRNTPGTLVPSSWTIRYTCSYDYYPNTTSDHSSCDNATWTNPVGCVKKPGKKCPPLESLNLEIKCRKDGSRVSCHRPMEPGTVALSRCKLFYESSSLPEQRTINCLDSGEWSYPLLRCTPVCGVQKRPFIVNDSSTSQALFPWFAALYKRNNESQKFEPICRGTLITPHIILTAAHCVVNRENTRALSPDDFKVSLGKYDRHSTEGISSFVYDVGEVIVPKSYVGILSNYALDIALVDLERSVEVTASVMPACFDWSGSLNLDFHTNLMMVAGFGDTELSEPSDVILATNMTFISYDDCLKSFPARQKPLLTHDKFCLKSINGREPGTGDSGVGFTVIINGRHYVVGILSSISNNISLATDVTQTEHSSWLQDKIIKLKEIHSDD